MNSHQQKESDDHNHPSAYCPSFSTYTTNTHIAEIACRVATLDINNSNTKFFEDDNNDDEEFEFGFASTTIPESSPVYPVFNRDLLRDLGSQETTAAKVELRNLFFKEDNNDEQDRLSMSSDHLNELSPETYCLWVPKTPETPSPSRCMKSSSTGSGPVPVLAKTWRLRNLLRRCRSDGKEGLMLMSTSTPQKVKEKIVKERPQPSLSPSPPRSGGSNRRKSYLPYKQELLGLFGSAQTLRKINIPPF